MRAFSLYLPDTLRNGSDSKNSGTSLNRLEEFITNYIGRLRHLFAFAYVWSFGGDLHERLGRKHLYDVN